MRSSAVLNLRRKLTWVAILYFAEGFPYGLFKDLIPVYFRYHGVDLKKIGLMSLLALPWTLKVFWSPIVDRYGTLRGWIGSMLILLAVICAAIPMFDPAHPTPLLWGLVAALTIASATQDVAIDALTIRMLDRDDEGPANGIRVSAYRVAIILGGGFFAGSASYYGWTAVFDFCAVTLALGAVIVFRAPLTERITAAARINSAVWIGLGLLGGFIALKLLHVELPNPIDGIKHLGLGAGAQVLATAGFVLAAFMTATYIVSFAIRKKRLFTHSWVARPAAPILVLFILLYRVGDFAIGPMIRPFWVDAGFKPNELFLVTTVIGITLSISGALTGGWIVRKIGLFHALWILGIAQAAVNLGYSIVAGLGLKAVSPERYGFYAASVIESFGMGLGIAAFLALLMRVCNKEHAATEYASLSAIFGFTGAVAGAFSGWGTEAVGYSTYFTVTFLISLPPLLLLLIPALRDWIERGTQSAGSPA